MASSPKKKLKLSNSNLVVILVIALISIPIVILVINNLWWQGHRAKGVLDSVILITPGIAGEKLYEENSFRKSGGTLFSFEDVNLHYNRSKTVYVTSASDPVSFTAQLFKDYSDSGQWTADLLSDASIMEGTGKYVKFIFAVRPTDPRYVPEHTSGTISLEKYSSQEIVDDDLLLKYYGPAELTQKLKDHFSNSTVPVYKYSVHFEYFPGD